MWDAISKLMGLIPALIRELPVGQRRVGVFGILSVVLAIIVCGLIALRLRGGVPETAVTASLAIVLDVKMIVFGVVAITVVLAWLVVLLYSLYRNH